MRRDKRNFLIYITIKKLSSEIWRIFCIDFDYDRILVGYFAERGSSSLDQFVKGAAKQCPDQWPSRSPDRIGRLIDFMLYKFLKKCNLIGSKRKYVAFTGSMLKSLGLININRDLLTSSKTRRVRVFHDRVNKTIQYTVLGRKYVIFLKKGQNGLNVV